MRLVVDLNDEVYNNMVVKNEYTHMDVIAVHNALMGAICIPEGHGRLIDADELCEGRVNNDIVVIAVKHASTIIEADKGW